MVKSNKANGNAFEREFCKILADHGFWAHNMAQNQQGQPADVIAIKGDITLLADCKVVSGDSFSLSRMEDNQISSMRLWMQRCHTIPQFAIRLPNGGIYMAPFPVLYVMLENGTTRIKNDAIKEMFPRLEVWLKECE